MISECSQALINLQGPVHRTDSELLALTGRLWGQTAVSSRELHLCMLHQLSLPGSVLPASMSSDKINAGGRGGSCLTATEFKQVT